MKNSGENFPNIKFFFASMTLQKIHVNQGVALSALWLAEKHFGLLSLVLSGPLFLF
jgi:hypothetical protein